MGTICGAVWRLPDAASSLTIGLTYPIVMGEGRARILAERRLADTLDTETRTISLPPETGPGLEILDRVGLNGAEWIVQRIEEQGIQRQLTLRAASGAVVRSQKVEPPAASLAATVPADPFGTIIDGPVLDHLEGLATFVAVRGDPWSGPVSIKMGTDAETLGEVDQVSQPAAIGRLQTTLSAGPLGRWDEASQIALYMPGEVLSSASEAAVLAGQNRLLVENDAGWELVAWRMAELIGTDQWLLSGLLRGLSGSPIQAAVSGANVVLADDRLVPIALGKEEFRREFQWQIGDGELMSFTVEDRASAPWRVGHLNAHQTDGSISISWTARGSEFADNWEHSDPDMDLSFKIQILSDGVVIAEHIQTESELTIAASEANLVRVTAASAQGRVGEWGSIPV